MIIYTIVSSTIIGDFTHEFTSRAQAEYWMGLCSANDIDYSVTYARVDAPTQLDLLLSSPY